MSLQTVIGAAQILRDGTIEGWCWSPDRPTSRLVVEIRLDDKIIATVLAEEFREDLQLGGCGDGHCGFRVMRLLDREPPGWLLAAREFSTGRIFAQTKLRAHSEQADPSLHQIEADIADARALAARRTPPARLPALQSAFAAAAVHLDAAGSDAATAVRRALARKLPPGCRFAVAESPAFSILIHAQDAEAALARVRGVWPLLERGDAELLLSDGGLDPRIPVLSSLLPSASLVRSRPGLIDAVEQAATLARGRRLIIITARPRDTGLDDLFALPETSAAVVAGPVVTAAGRRAGVVHADKHAYAAPAGLLGALEPGLLAELGGFDPALSETPHLAFLDLCLKAELLGEHVLWLRHPSAPTIDAPEHAVAHLIGRWAATFSS